MRAIVGALDNAQASDARPTERAQRGVDVAGASPGVGSTEATPRPLSSERVRQILDAEITELSEQAARYASLVQPDRAARRRHQSDVGKRYRQGP